MESSISPRIIIMISIPVILFIAVLALSSNPIIPNQMDIEVKTYQGNKINSTDYKGKIQIVEFFTSWCAGCKEITNNIKSVLSNTSFNHEDVVVLSITIDPFHDTEELLSNFISNYSLNEFVDSGNWMFARDLNEYHTYYSVSVIPHSFLVGKDGQILDQHIGVISTQEIYSWILEARQHTT